MFGRLIFDSDIEGLLFGNTYDKIAMILINGDKNIINEVGNYIKREELDIVSYLPKSKVDSLAYNADPYSSGIGRVSIRIGRFVNKFLRKTTFINYNISPQDLEGFVNLYKSYFLRSETNIKLVQGDEILKWYNEDSYYCDNDNRFGSLWSSCMRQSERNKFMKLYSDNTRMLILLADNGKLLGRAILWDKAIDANGVEYKVMDRIYTIYDHDVNLFKDWAKKNGFCHKLEQSAKTEKYFVKYDADGRRESFELDMSVNMVNHVQKYYPYLDTFKFYNPTNGKFSNSSSLRDFQYILIQSDGSVTPPEPEEINDEYEEDYVDNDW